MKKCVVVGVLLFSITLAFPEDFDWDDLAPAGAVKELGKVSSVEGWEVTARYWPEHKELYLNFEMNNSYSSDGFGFVFKSATFQKLREALAKFQSWTDIARANAVTSKVEKTIYRLEAYKGWIRKGSTLYRQKQVVMELAFFYNDSTAFLKILHGDMTTEEGKSTIVGYEPATLETLDARRLAQIVSQKSLNNAERTDNLFN